MSEEEFVTEDEGLEGAVEPQEDIFSEPADDTPSEELTPEQAYEAAQQEQAKKGGWQDLNDWIESGKDAKDWVPAHHFNLKGEFIGKIKAKDREFEERLSAVQQLHNKQLEIQRQELIDKRDAAALQGGEEGAKAVREIQGQLDELNTPQQPAFQPSPVLEQWNEQNPWINEPSPKSTYARTVFQNALRAGATQEAAVMAVDLEINKHFPETAESKPKGKVPPTERGSKPGRKAGNNVKLTMNDLTQTERKMLAAFPKWSDEKKLQTVADARAKK